VRKKLHRVPLEELAIDRGDPARCSPSLLERDLVKLTKREGDWGRVRGWIWMEDVDQGEVEAVKDSLLKNDPLTGVIAVSLRGIFRKILDLLMEIRVLRL
jgi:hypothetical protein